RRLPRPRDVSELERTAELLERAGQTRRRTRVVHRPPRRKGGRLGRRIAETGQRLFVRRQACAVGRVERKVGPPVIRVFDVRNLSVAGCKREVGAKRVSVVKTGTAAENRAFGHLIGKAETRLEV